MFFLSSAHKVEQPSIMFQPRRFPLHSFCQPSLWSHQALTHYVLTSLGCIKQTPVCHERYQWCRGNLYDITRGEFESCLKTARRRSKMGLTESLTTQRITETLGQLFLGCSHLSTNVNMHNDTPQKGGEQKTLLQTPRSHNSTFFLHCNTNVCAQLLV